MELAKNGKIKGLCQSNALLTFKENLVDFASPSTRQAGEALIDNALMEMELPTRNTVQDRLDRITRGARDLCF